jgi:hypothetical protein
VVMGPSQGGLVSLAYGSQARAGTRLVVSISGGLRLGHCPAWEANLVEAMAGFAQPTKGLSSL